MRGLTASVALLCGLSVAAMGCGSDPDPCAGIDCGEHGSCQVVGGRPFCECEANYQQVGSRCEAATDGGLPMCGNGTREATEVCDGEDLDGETCESLNDRLGNGTLLCAADCGGYVLDQCESQCGDGIRAGGETCDGSDVGTATCVSEGFYGGTLGCQTDCTAVDPGGCVGVCGDGVAQLGPEVCDGTDLAGADCRDANFYQGSLACTADCRYDTAGCVGTCGDGIIQGTEGEVCDATDLQGETCLGLGYIGGDLGCGSDCRYDVSQCQTNCGDGILDFGEVCDDGNQDAGDACSPDCTAGLGKIVFVSNRSGAYELWSMLDDGSNVTQLTDSAPDSTACAGAVAPRWSPDGSRVAYRYGGDAIVCAVNSTIHVVTADGSDLGAVVTAPMGGGLSWTPDGSAIVYTAGFSRTLRIVTVATGVDAPYYDGDDQERDPDLHPFVDRFVFSRFQTGGDYPGIFAAGGAQPVVELVGMCSGCDLFSPRWSSNGARVLYHRSGGVYWVTPDGATSSVILASQVDHWVDWAGDTRVVFQDGSIPANPNIALINIDGSGRTGLTTFAGYDGQPDWHPGERDSDLDQVLDYEDNCVHVQNYFQDDTDSDGIGDACDQ